MQRAARIAVNFLLPPSLATGYFVAITTVVKVGELHQRHSATSSSGAISDIVAFGFMIVFYAYLIAGLPSLLHATLMEFAYLKFPAHRWAAVGISTLSGAFAGIVITGFLVNWQLLKIPDKPFLIALGCSVGFSLGLFIKWLHRSKIDRPAPTLRGCE
jgi:hypothetical protein